jgi:uncharacterized membrane protein
MTMEITKKEEDRLIEAIKAAELSTSGEIKVHIEKECPLDNPFDRAIQIFDLLALHTTAQRNGVLFYLAYKDRKFAILGDHGINNKVGQDFWDSTANILKSHYKQNQFVDGLCNGITEAGIQLKKHFPYHANDKNELSDDISFGN